MGFVSRETNRISTNFWGALFLRHTYVASKANAGDGLGMAFGRMREMTWGPNGLVCFTDRWSFDIWLRRTPGSTSGPLTEQPADIVNVGAGMEGP